MRPALFRVLATNLVLLPTAYAITGDQQRALDIQNDMRASMGVPQLTWDDGLAWAAQDWANQLGGFGELVHNSGGENLYMQSWTSDNPISQAAEAWVSEANNYHGESIPDGDFSNYGHYTQCLWSSTQRVGMAAAEDGQGRTFVVARYDPPGNFIGERPY